MNDKNLIVFVGLVVMAILLTVVLSDYYRKHELNKYIYFEVDSVENSPSMRCILYDINGDKLRLQTFVFYDYHRIEKGDIIVKQPKSEALKVYRRNEFGEEQLYITIIQS